MKSIFSAPQKINKAASHTLIHGQIVSDGRLVDDVLLSIFRVPHSYTGEDVIEISCHGNPFIYTQILALLHAEASPAEAGEFTFRAFTNHKIDLTKAEAVGDLYNAQTRHSQAIALNHLEGDLYQHIKQLLAELSAYRTLLELEIDFLEQDLSSLDETKLREDLKSLAARLRQLASSAEEGLIISHGLRVSFAGLPNVGKSSIFNAILESERSIVTDEPGTTRDYLEEAVSIDGYLIKLIDTAGLRDTANKAEKIGIDRAREMIDTAHLVIYVTDTDDDTAYAELCQVVEKNRILRVFNKADLLESPAKLDPSYLYCSTLTAGGIGDLKTRILAAIPQQSNRNCPLLNNQRQVIAVQKAAASLAAAISSLEQGLGYEFTAFDLKESSQYLEQVIGQISSDDLLNQIFAEFCIGK